MASGSSSTTWAGRPGRGGVVDGTWPDHWARTWGARGLRYVWVEEAAAAITAGLADDEWRPAEMCLKVAALREVGTAGDGAVRLPSTSYRGYA